MRKKRAYVALDLGAESGRVMLAEFDGEHISLSEVYRFANKPVRVLDHLHWPLLELWRAVKAGLAKVAMVRAITPQDPRWHETRHLLRSPRDSELRPASLHPSERTGSGVPLVVPTLHRRSSGT